ncbi:MAG TPA: hypothetical protein VK324_05335 [Tepidisphaeraceae bacterium]|nr:hypothetical protein [Tepidisphaeraceae bacterium]
MPSEVFPAPLSTEPVPQEKWNPLAGQDQSLVAVAAVASYAAAWWIGRWTRVPAEPGFDPSVTGQPSVVLAVLVTAVVVGVGGLIAAVLVGRHRPEAAVFGAACGLAALSYRGGTMTNVLHDAASTGVFVRLVVETLILTTLLLATWFAIGRRKAVPSEAADDGGNAMLATATATVIAGVLAYLLVPVDVKLQAMGGVFFAGLIGAWTAYAVFPARGAMWYWLAVPRVGVIGYALAWFQPGQYMVGMTDQPLAHPIPLDYCGIGVAGAILGYWSGRKRDGE